MLSGFDLHYCIQLGERDIIEGPLEFDDHDTALVNVNAILTLSLTRIPRAFLSIVFILHQTHGLGNTVEIFEQVAIPLMNNGSPYTRRRPQSPSDA